jgi:MFS family permease
MAKRNLTYIYLLSALVYFTQGIGTLASQPLYYYLKETLKMSVPLVMLLGSLTSIPWMIKPIYGFLSDNFPILGYKRKSYIILSCILSITTALTLGLTGSLPIAMFICILVIDAFGGAIKDVAIDGVMVEEGKKYNLTGKIQAIQWGSLTLASVITGVGGGYIATRFDYHMAFLLIALFPMAILGLSLMYGEEKCTVKTGHLPFKDICKKYLVDFKNKQFVLAACFLFCLWFSPSVGTPIMERMRESLHLSKIWIGWLTTIGAISSVFGAVLYFKLGKKINIKKWLYGGIILSAVSTFAYLYLTPQTVLIYSVLFGLSGMFVHLIMMDFMARACPEGTEATMFALLCSIVNFGSFCSTLAGAKLYMWFGYNGLVIIAGVFTLFCLFFVPHLKIPQNQSE